MSESLNVKSPKSGFTLIELLVYIVLTAIVTTIASNVWFNSAIFSLNSKARMRSSSDVNQLMIYLEEDINRVGSNVDMELNVINTSTMAYNESHGGAVGDKSSFGFSNSGSTDSLGFYTLVYKTVGPDQVLDGVENVIYTIGGDSLYRRVIEMELDGTPLTDNTVLMGDHITEFNIDVGQYDTSSVAFNSTDLIAPQFQAGGDLVIAPTASGGDITVSGFEKDKLSWWDVADSTGSIRALALEKGATYEVKFQGRGNDDFASNFNKNEDELMIEILDASGGSLNNVAPYVFYPGMSGSTSDYSYSFSSPVTSTNAKLRFSVKLAKITGSPSFSFEDMSFELSNLGKYDWKSTNAEIDAGVREQSKALRLTIVINNAINKRDNKSRIEKIIKIPNNGIFN